jgi:hypothetical protein
LFTTGLVAAITPNATLTADQLATRFLAQATFGPSPGSLAELKALGYDYSAKAAKPATSAVSIEQAAKDAALITTFDTSSNRRARNQAKLSGADQLRQRSDAAILGRTLLAKPKWHLPNRHQPTSARAP